jgi:uncharacterized protein
MPEEDDPMEPVAANILFIIAYLLIIIGVVGAIVPVLPGPLIIWIGMLLWAWVDGFVRIGWWTLIILAVLALIAWISDFLLSTVISRRAGASWRSILGSIVGGIAGAILMSWIPLLGTVLGALLGAAAGMWLVEYYDKGNAQAATTALRAYIVSMAAAAVVELGLVFIMLGIFAWQAFY